MYELHFRKDAHTKNSFSLLGQADSLEEIRKLRVASGDLVTQDGWVVDSQDWLFDWEKKDPTCYAQRAISVDRQNKKDWEEFVTNTQQTPEKFYLEWLTGKIPDNFENWEFYLKAKELTMRIQSHFL